MAKPEEKTTKDRIRRVQSDRSRMSSERITEVASIYWRLILESLGIGLAVWLLGVAGPRVGINVPPLFFIPTAYVIALAFIRDPGRDRVRAFSFAIIIGFIFLVIVSGLAPYVYQFLGYGEL